MKRLFLLFLMAFGLYQTAFSQICSPNNSYILGGFYPKDSLPATCKGNDYESVITWVIPKDTFFNNIASQIDSVQLWEILGLPVGINYTSSSNHYLGGTKGCIRLDGNPTISGHFPLTAVCQWFYHQNGNPLAKIDSISLPILPIYPALTTQIIAISDAHCGQHDGTAVLYAYGVYPPFTYSWDNGQVGTVATQLASGLYIVHIQNTIGCSLDKIVSLEALDNTINAILQIQNLSCANGNDGEIEVFASGTAPFTYQWSNGSTSAHPINLASGFYEVAITDADSCAAVYTATLNGPSEIVLNATISPDTMLLGLGKIVLQVTGGAGGYTYSWSNGNTSASNTGLSAGSYSVWVTDAIGCVEMGSYMLFSVSILANENAFISPSFFIYPNPNEGIFSIKGAFSPQEKIEIYDMSGQNILFKSRYLNEFEIEMQGMGAGLYLLKIGAETQIFSLK